MTRLNQTERKMCILFLLETAAVWELLGEGNSTTRLASWWSDPHKFTTLLFVSVFCCVVGAQRPQTHWCLPWIWNKTFAPFAFSSLVWWDGLTRPCMSWPRVQLVHLLSTPRPSWDLHTPAPLLMRALIIRCAGPVRPHFIYPPSADVKMMIH